MEYGKVVSSEGEGFELTGRLSPSDRKLYAAVQTIIAKWKTLPMEEQTKRAAVVYEEAAKLRGRPDAADQLELGIRNRFPEIKLPSSTPGTGASPP